MLTFENVILRLQQFWRGEGCLLTQPMNTEVGAGTMNPNTFLHVLGPEPWSVAYAEPSVRPDDSRYGSNPNRIQTHTQFQVILKPDPGDPQERYLRSLKALGIDTEKHDVRFVEDNWESPALGAWGLGWEVWLDGLEITQFTYFQQSGGFALDPVSVEITYGLERILMALQGASHFKDIAYSDTYSYGDLLARSEFEWSTYFLDVANVARVREISEMYEAEALEMLEKGLVLPAYNYVLKLSHTFNILDARGAIGVSERAAFFARMRTISRRCAQSWLDASGTDAEQAAPPSRTVPGIARAAHVESGGLATSDLVVEIGTEELPPSDLDTLVEQARGQVGPVLAAAGLGHGGFEVEGTPRRLVLTVRALEAVQPVVTTERRGPRADVAWAPDGAPTQAAVGFAKRNRVDVEALRSVTIDDVEYAVADATEGGRSSLEVLGEAIPEILRQLKVTRGMRWNASGTTFSRPIRWILALHGEHVVPVEFAGVSSGRETRLLRSVDQPAAVEVVHADAHAGHLREAGILMSKQVRRARIGEELERLSAEVHARAHADVFAQLLDEVANLVEAPRVALGRFDERYLALPQAVLVTVMVKHQRYFPLTAAGQLVPHFGFVANGRGDMDVIRQGNEAVIRARYADAEFFYQQDTSRPLADYHDRLERMMFHERLGSMSDKVARLRTLASDLGSDFGLGADEQEALDRAAQLAKDDLGTALVTEFSGLAGVMGAHYARLSHESDPVAQAIADHVKPASSGGQLPSTRIGAVLALADRLDTLVGLFAAGVVPRGTADPFGLRRVTNGLIEVVSAFDFEFDLRSAIDRHAKVLPRDLTVPTEEILAWVWRRFEVILREEDQVTADVARAALGGTGTDIARTRRVARDLTRVIETPTWEQLAESLQRVTAIARKLEGEPSVDPALFTEAAEHELWSALSGAGDAAARASGLDQLIEALGPLNEPIARFFDDVFVMAGDAAIARNRLSLLRLVAALPSGSLDVSVLRGRSAAT
jgi:glycyl-tRNA synthetase